MWLPDLWRWVFKRAADALRRGDTNRAQEIFSSYARRRPKDPHAWLIWGRFLLASGDHEKAEGVLREGLRANAGNLDLLAELGDALSSGSSGLDDPRWREGGTVIDEVLRLAPDHPRALLFRFVRSTFLTDFDEMRRLGRLASKRMTYQAPEEISTAFELASFMVGVPGLQEEAIDIFNRLVERSPRDHQAHAHLGILLERKDPERAAAHSQMARELWTDNMAETLYKRQEAIREELREGEADERDASSKK